jgi:hypothetical protein
MISMNRYKVIIAILRDLRCTKKGLNIGLPEALKVPMLYHILIPLNPVNIVSITVIWLYLTKLDAL